jgi:hypothetical protein
MAQLTAEQARGAIAANIQFLEMGLERLMGVVRALKASALTEEPEAELDPRAPENKYPNGRLTPRGVEVCYRLFDAGKTVHAVKKLMAISYGGADGRWKKWKALGGAERSKASLK